MIPIDNPINTAMLYHWLLIVLFLDTLFTTQTTVNQAMRACGRLSFGSIEKLLYFEFLLELGVWTELYAISAIAIRINSDVGNTALHTHCLLHVYNIRISLIISILDVHFLHTEIRQANIVCSFRDIDMIFLLRGSVSDIAGTCNYVLLIPLSSCHLWRMSIFCVHWLHTAC